MKLNTSIFELDEDIGFQMAPMIDVTFLLIIFFMVAANVNTAERIKVNLPVAENATIPKEPSGRINVTINEKGIIFAGIQKVNEKDLEQNIAASIHENPNLRVFLRADGRVKHGAVRKAMEAIAQGGITDIIFSTYQSTD